MNHIKVLNIEEDEAIIEVGSLWERKVVNRVFILSRDEDIHYLVDLHDGGLEPITLDKLRENYKEVYRIQIDTH